VEVGEARLVAAGLIAPPATVSSTSARAGTSGAAFAHTSRRAGGRRARKGESPGTPCGSRGSRAARISRRWCSWRPGSQGAKAGPPRSTWPVAALRRPGPRWWRGW